MKQKVYGGSVPLATAQIGDDLGSFEIEITEEQVERNAWANDDYNPWYIEDSPFGGRIVSPVFMSSLDGSWRRCTASAAATTSGPSAPHRRGRRRGDADGEDGGQPGPAGP